MSDSIEDDVRSFINGHLMRIVRGEPAPDFTGDIAAFVDSTPNPTVTLVILAGLGIQGYGGLLKVLHPDPGQAQGYLDRVDILTAAAAIVDADDLEWPDREADE